MVVNWSYNHRTDEIAQREHILTIALLVQTEPPPPHSPRKRDPHRANTSWMQSFSLQLNLFVN